MSNDVLVLDTDRKPLTPCKPSMARKLLSAGKAKVFRIYPFTIILSKRVDGMPEPMELKLDPGSRTTGIALIQDGKVVWGGELTHRGLAIKSGLDSRRAIRRSRRNRKTRYRKPRFLNRKLSSGWLAPSVQHRVLTTLTWVNRLRRYAPIKGISQELVKFDLQKMENPEISGVQYQQGTLLGYEVRQYLLEKWNRKCAYCSVENVPLQIEHIQPLAKQGSDRVSNLCLACEKCNTNKGTKDIKDFLKNKPDVLARILKQAKMPLQDAAAVNSTRWALFNALKAIGLPLSTGSGGQTKFNRTRFALPKHHWIDAACVGQVDRLKVLTKQPLLIKTMGWGCRQMVQMDKYGFPRKGYKPKQKVKGWNTGDIVSVIAGKHEGVKCKRIKTTRAKGSFDVRVNKDTLISVSKNQIKPVHRSDGYSYSFV